MARLGQHVCCAQRVGAQYQAHSISGSSARCRVVACRPPLLPSLQVRAAAAAPQAQGRLHYLDFFDALLTHTPAGAALAPGLALDGTHLSPDYLVHLRAALAEVQ